MRCVFEVVDPVEDARGTQNWKEYPEAREGLYDQISHGALVMQVCGFCALFEMKIDEILYCHKCELYKFKVNECLKKA